jgi:hypothetical protein
MTKATNKKYPKSEVFTHKNRKVEVRVKDGTVEIVVDGRAHDVRFLDNGRPYMSEFVNVMATSVKDLAELFVEFSAAQEAHWAEVDKGRQNQSVKK